MYIKKTYKKKKILFKVASLNVVFITTAYEAFQLLYILNSFYFLSSRLRLFQGVLIVTH